MIQSSRFLACPREILPRVMRSKGRLSNAATAAAAIYIYICYSCNGIFTARSPRVICISHNMYNNIIYYNNTYCRRASVNDNIAEDDGRVIYRRLRPTSVYTLLCILYTVVVEYIQRLHGRYVTYVCARNTCKEFFLFVKKKMIYTT